MATEKLIKELKGLGPKSQAMLARADITTYEQLKKLGSIEAFVRTKRLNPSASLNLLWGLESVITGEHWRVVAKKYRTSLLLALEEREKQI